MTSNASHQFRPAHPPEAHPTHQLTAFVNTGFTAAFTPLWAAFEMVSCEPLLLATLRDFGRQAVAKRHDQLEADDRRYRLSRWSIA